MRSWTSFFLIFCLVLVFGFLRLYQGAKDLYGDTRDAKDNLAKAEKQLRDERARTLLLAEQIYDINQEVVSQTKSNGADSFRKQLLVDVSRRPAQAEGLQTPQILMSKAKAEFSEKKLNEAIASFTEYISKYQSASGIIEAHFLLAESYYLAGRLEESLSIIHTMMVQFPNSSLTGFIMIRLAQTLEYRRRHEEAREVYKIIVANFAQNATLVQQAQTLLGKMR
jgi:TolA-binding protein